MATELEAQLKAWQVYEQNAGAPNTSYGVAFWELLFPNGEGSRWSDMS